MRKRSVKVKITLWYLLLMGLMGRPDAGLSPADHRSVYTQSAMEQLDQTVRENLGQVIPCGRAAPDGGGVPVL